MTLKALLKKKIVAKFVVYKTTKTYQSALFCKEAQRKVFM